MEEWCVLFFFLSNVRIVYFKKRKTSLQNKLEASSTNRHTYPSQGEQIPLNKPMQDQLAE
jgi:hypothetical protein